MDNKTKKIDTILIKFLLSEAESTDKRIMSIRAFIAALNNAVDKYIVDSSWDADKKDRERLAEMVSDMMEIYSNEVSDLLVKRGKLQHYIELFNIPAPNADNIQNIVSKETTLLN